jgi:hypothetical protein
MLFFPSEYCIRISSTEDQPDSLATYVLISRIIVFWVYLSLFLSFLSFAVLNPVSIYCELNSPKGVLFVYTKGSIAVNG